MITLKEAFLAEAPNALDTLDKQVGKISDAEEAKKFVAGYASFLELVDFLAGTALDGPHSAEEKAFRQDPDTDPFFKFLLSRAKNDLFSGTLDWDHFPNERTLVHKVFRALKDNKPSPVQLKPASPLSPEEAELRHADKMHRGDYGKLDQ